MSLERHPKYPDVWVARIYPNGRPKDPDTGKPTNKGRKRYLYEGDEAGALNWYASLLKTPQAVETPLAPTLEQAWPKFCEYYKNHVSESTYKDYLKTWNRHLKPFFGRFRPVQLNAGIIESYKSKRLLETYLPGKRFQLPKDDTTEAEKKRRKPVSKKRIQNELYYISAMTSWMASPSVNMAQKLNFEIKGFPAKDTKAPIPVIPGRREVLMLIRRADRPYRAMLYIWYNAGLRKTELLTLEGNRINLAYWYMIVRGKGNKERIVPIHRKLRVFIRKAMRPGYLWISPRTGRPYVSLDKALKRAADRAKLSQRIYLHLLRHCFGTHGIESGINPRAMQLLLGHSSMKTTEIYTTLAAQTLTSEMNKFGGGGPAKREAERQKLFHELLGTLRESTDEKANLQKLLQDLLGTLRQQSNDNSSDDTNS